MITFFKSIWDLFFGSNNDELRDEYKNRIEDKLEALSKLIIINDSQKSL